MTKEQFIRKYPEGKTFDILGTTYTLHYNDKICAKNDANGLAELYAKKIILSLRGYDDEHAFEKIEKYYQKVLRHELVHAFLFEMGFTEYTNDETLVDALAVKMPQIIELMKEV